MLEKRPVLLASIILAVLVAVIFYAPIFQGKVFVSGDSLAPTAAIKPLAKYFWETFEYPTWNPYIFAGMPSVGSVMYTPFGYFPYIPFEILNQAIDVNFLLIHILHFLATGIFMFIFCRSKDLDFFPSLFGSIAWTFAPFLIVMETVGHGSQLMTTAYIPIVFWAVDKLFEKQNFYYFALSSLLFGMQFQRSHPQISYYTLLLVGLYFLFKVVYNFKDKNKPDESVKMLGFLAGAVVLGLGLAAMIYLPIYEYTPYSIRGISDGGSGGGAGFDYATQWSLHPKEMITFLVPSFFGFGGQTYWGFMPFTDYPNYVGIATVLLAIFTLAYKRERITVFFWAAVILAFVISWGKETPILYKPLYEILPYFNKFRVPAMIMVLVQFGLAFLAAKGIQNVFEIAKMKEKELSNFSKKFMYVGGGLLGVFVIILVLQSEITESYNIYNSSKGIPQQYYKQFNTQRWDLLSKDLTLGFVFLIATIGLGFAAIKKSISPMILGVGLCVVLVFDVFRIGFNLQDPKPSKNIENYLKPTADVIFLKNDKSAYRILPLGRSIQNSNVWAAHEISTILGYHPAKIGRYQKALDKITLQNRSFLNMLNVKYFVVEGQKGQFPSTKEVFSGEQRTVYENLLVMPRAFFVKSYEAVKDENEIFRKMSVYDPKQTAFVEGDLNLQILPNFNGKVKNIKTSLQSLEVETESNSEGLLVLSEIGFEPGWKAYIDGNETKIFPANYVLQSVKVPAGTHKVELRMELDSFQYGKMATILCALFCFGSLIFFRKQRE